MPLSFMPLYFASFCIYMAFVRGNAFCGFLCAGASIGLTFLMAGLSATFFFLVIIFAPYAVVCALFKKFNYRSVKTAIIRALSMIVIINGLLYLAYFTIFKLVLTDIPIMDWVDKMHGYAVFAVVATVIFLPLDVILTEMSPIILKRIGGGEKAQKTSRQDKQPQQQKEPLDVFEEFDTNNSAEKPAAEPKSREQEQSDNPNNNSPSGDNAD